MKSFKILALVAILGLGACSLNDSDFLDQVKGKTAFTNALYSGEIGKFSADGKTFTYNGIGDLIFDSMEEDSLARYTFGKTSYTISVDGGKIGLRFAGMGTTTTYYIK